MADVDIEKLPLEEALAFKLLKVPVEHDLYKIVEALKGKLRSILSIYRVYDYTNQQRCNEVIVILRDELEYRVLREMKKVLIGSQEIEMDFKRSYFGSANCSKYITDSNERNIGPSPISLKIAKLTEVSRITTDYLSKILLAFESTDNRDVTGITFTYDNKRDSIRPFGFISFSNINSMLKFHGKRVRVWEEFVDCEGSYQVPFLLSEPNMVLLKENPKEFRHDICQANQLNDTPFYNTELRTTLPSAINQMQIDDSAAANTEEYMSDDESILSIDLDYDFDEDFNIIKK
jgi:hypothetical protein